MSADAADARTGIVGGPDAAELRELERDVRAALRSGDQSALRTLGWGEVGPVLGWPADEPAFALKRLPPFAGRAACEAFALVLHDYLAALAQQGLECMPTEVRVVEGGDQTIGYVVQRRLPPGCLVPEVLRAGDPAAGHPAIEAIVDADITIPRPLLALDGQASNYAWVDGRLLYLDVTTPLLFDDAGRLRMDIDLLLGSLPAVLRPAVRRWVVPGLLRRFRDPRAVLLDMLGNLIKERLDAWLPVAIAATAGRVDPPLSAEEVRRSYRSDALLWEVLLRLRRIDRAWQHHVRRRAYPYLLPGAIER